MALKRLISANLFFSIYFFSSLFISLISIKATVAYSTGNTRLLP